LLSNSYQLSKSQTAQQLPWLALPQCQDIDGLVTEENLGNAEVGSLAIDMGDTGAPE
jgi:hypothetical protein